MHRNPTRRVGRIRTRTLHREDDADLLLRWRAGDPRAAQQLVRRHYAKVERFFRRQPPPEVADLVQNTFLRCLQVQHELLEPEKFAAFLMGIARNELLRRRERNAGPRGRVDSLDATELEPSTTIAEHLESAQAYDRFESALRTLPAELRIAIELHYREQLTGAEVADRLGIPEGTARSRIRLGRARLCDALACHCPPPAAPKAAFVGGLTRSSSARIGSLSKDRARSDDGSRDANETRGRVDVVVVARVHRRAGGRRG
jgi:RNA polymerase sigma factor (sigma-70 family)